jgi:hypothetical protein
MRWTNAPMPRSTRPTRSGSDPIEIEAEAVDPNGDLGHENERRADVGRRTDVGQPGDPRPDEFDTGSVPRLRRADRA